MNTTIEDMDAVIERLTESPDDIVMSYRKGFVHRDSSFTTHDGRKKAALSSGLDNRLLKHLLECGATVLRTFQTTDGYLVRKEDFQ